MSEYPEDVMKAARECADLCLYTTDDRMALHIARAIMAERDRCAKAVEAGLGLTNTAIARKIRSGE